MSLSGPGGDGPGPGSLGGPPGIRSTRSAEPGETWRPQALLPCPAATLGWTQLPPWGYVLPRQQRAARGFGPAAPGALGPGTPPPCAVLPAGATPRAEGRSQTRISWGEFLSHRLRLQLQPRPSPRPTQARGWGRCRPHNWRERAPRHRDRRGCCSRISEMQPPHLPPLSKPRRARLPVTPRRPGPLGRGMPSERVQRFILREHRRADRAFGGSAPLHGRRSDGLKRPPGASRSEDGSRAASP